MQVRRKQLVGILTNRADNVAAPDYLSGANLDFVQMRIDRSNFLLLVILIKDMVDHHHVSPQLAAEVRKRNLAVGNSVNVLAQVARRRTIAGPVFASVNSIAVEIRKVRGYIPT